MGFLNQHLILQLQIILTLGCEATYRYINKERAIPIDEGTLLVYLCCNPIYHKNMLDTQNKKNWPVVSIDTLDNNLVRYHDNLNAAR